MAQDPAKKVSNPRIAKLIELEAAGRIKPEHQAELDSYRNQGLAPKRVTGGGTESERTAAFLATRVADEVARLSEIGSDGNPTLATEGAALFGRLGNYATPEARQRARNAQLNLLDAALTLGTGAAYTREQLEGYRQSYFPDIGEDEQTIADKADRLKVLLEAARVKAGESAGQINRALTMAGLGKPGENDVVDAPTAVRLGAPSDLVKDKVAGASESGAEQYSTERDKEYAAALRSAFNKGADKDDLDAIAVSFGYPPLGPGFDRAVKTRDRGGKVSIAIPMSGWREPNIVGKLAASDLGAGMIAAANAVTAGTLDEIVGATGGDAERAQLAKEVSRAAHPTADLVGNVAGGVIATLGANSLLTRFGLPAAANAPTLAPRLIAEDAIYGTAYGAGESNDARLSGAVMGGVAGVAGGIGGRYGLNTAGRALAPTGGKLVELYNAGVRPTLGQRFSNSGLVGRTVNRIEEGLQSLPVLGNAVRGARQGARDQWERGAFDEALGEIGERLPADVDLGTAPHAYMQDAFNRAYEEARSGMQFVPDKQFFKEQEDFAKDLLSGILTDDQSDQVEKILRTVVESRLRDGRLTGEAYNLASSDIGKAAKRLSATNPLVSEALTSFQAILDNGARRSSLPKAVAKLDAADRGYAKVVRIEEAASRVGGDTGRFTPNQFERAVQKTSGGVRSREYLRGDALMSDYAQAGKSLVDRVPDSGTGERLTTAGLFGLGGAAATGGSMTGTLPAAFGLGAVATAPYLPGVRKLTTGLLAPRSTSTRAGRGLTTLGKVLKERSRLGGAIAAPALVERQVND